MKNIAIFFSILFLFTFVNLSYAAELKLQETSSSTKKSIAVSIDTKSESTENVKITIQHSENVTITDIVESDIPCSTFSYVPSDSSSEIVCTLPSNQPVQGLIATILFTSSSDDYKFTIMQEESQIGDLTIDSVTNVGDNIKDSTTNDDTETSPTQLTTQETTTTMSETTAQKDNKIMAYLPYILLGVAGIFFIIIIVLSVTMKKDNVVLTDVPASVMPPQPTQPTPQPTQQPVDFENIPQNLQNETMQDNIAQSKPTLAEMINQPAQAPEQTTEQVPTVPETSPASSTPNEQADLEELLKSENPSMVTSTPTDTPNTIPSEEQVTLPQQPIQEANANTSSIINGSLSGNYSANVTEGGLPDVGSTSPLEVETDNLASPNLGSTEQPIESVVTQADTTSPMDNDLQNAVNMEINNIPTSVENNIEPEQPTTNENMTPPTGI